MQIYDPLTIHRELEAATKNAGTLDLINENSALKNRIASLQSENSSLKLSSQQFSFTYDGPLSAAPSSLSAGPSSLMSPISAGGDRSGSFDSSFPLFGGGPLQSFEMSASPSTAGFPLSPYGESRPDAFFQGLQGDSSAWRDNSATSDREIDSLLSFGGIIYMI
jgi:hypothetical protein